MYRIMKQSIFGKSIFFPFTFIAFKCLSFKILGENEAITDEVHPPANLYLNIYIYLLLCNIQPRKNPFVLSYPCTFILANHMLRNLNEYSKGPRVAIELLPLVTLQHRKKPSHSPAISQQKWMSIVICVYFCLSLKNAHVCV